MQGVANDDRTMTLVEHLQELRRVLIIAGGAWLAAGIVAFGLNRWIFALVLGPLRTVLGHTRTPVSEAIFLSPTEGLTIPLKVSAIVGFVLALPVIVWQVWTFVAPGLKPVERKFALPFIASSIVLFAAGVAFAYFVMPIGLGFLANFLGVNNAQYVPDLNQYLTFFLLLVAVFGITFELPNVLVLLGLLGIVSSKWLRERRKYIIVGLIFLALLVTPGADPFTPTALAIPLILLFEGSILVIDKVLHR